MLVAGEYNTPSGRAWRRGLWVSVLLVAVAVLSLAPYMRSSAELVRMRNAMLMSDEARADVGNWSPANVPPGFKLDQGPVPPLFDGIVKQLGLAALPDDWARALAISQHLLANSGARDRGPVMSDLQGTYRRIMDHGDGYCGDYVDVFIAIANAAGMPVRAWAFSFDGFGGHGHIWPEIWNRQLGRWQLLDVFNNAYFPDASGAPRSAMELRQAMLATSDELARVRLAPDASMGMRFDRMAWRYYRRGLPEWYLWWGNNVLSYDRATLVRSFSGISRSLEQLGGIAQGVHPGIHVLAEPGNQVQRDHMARLRWHLGAVVLVTSLAGLMSLVCLQALLRRRWQTRATVWARYNTVMGAASAADTQIVVLTNLFPHSGTPGAGPFIRERMFRVARTLPMVVVVPVPWFPFQGLLRRFRPHFRPEAPRCEVLEGVPVFIPRFLSIPGVFRCMDGLSMAIACWPLLRRLKRQHPRTLIDAHFAYPAGYAGVMLGRWLDLPATITMRGSEVTLAADPCRRARMATALQNAAQAIAVSDSLRQHAGTLGVDVAKVQVIGNGVDLTRFKRQDREAARARYGIAPQAPVLVSVGGLVERKGFHRVIALLPRLLEKHPGLRLLVVGGASPEGDMSSQLRQQVAQLQLEQTVSFLGALPPDEVSWPLSAANVFVLSTRNEGWANVFLEAMACGLPVVTTNVGGNAEVVCDRAVGTVVAFGDEQQLFDALDDALTRAWDTEHILAYARANTWDSRIAVLLETFDAVAKRHFHEEPGLGRLRGTHG